MVDVGLLLGLKREKDGEDITPHIVKKEKKDNADEEGRIEDVKSELLDFEFERQTMDEMMPKTQIISEHAYMEFHNRAPN